PLPTTAPISLGAAANGNSEVHNAGEVWTTMMFEAYASLLDRTTGPTPAYTYDEAHRRMSDYVVAGMRLAPGDPTYTEQRDGVLAAAAAADNDDFLAMATAFARRGAGTCAVSCSRYSQTFNGVIESFDLAPNVVIDSVGLSDSLSSCDNDGFLDVGETGEVTVSVTNAGAATATSADVSVTASSTALIFPDGSTATIGPIAPFATVDVKLRV